MAPWDLKTQRKTKLNRYVLAEDDEPEPEEDDEFREHLSVAWRGGGLPLADSCLHC